MIINHKEILSETSNILKSIVSTIYQTKDESFIQNVLLAKSVGLSTTAGAFGLASLVGTASTGTAIGTLNGVVFTNTALAWIGGSVFTGTILLTSGAIATGYVATKLYNGKMRETNEIQEYEKEIINACLILVKSILEEKALDTEVNTEQLKLLFNNALYPLLMKIYVNSDDISSNLNTKYKIGWRTHRIKLVDNLDTIRSLIKGA